MRGASSSGEPLDTAGMRADMDEPMSVLGYRRRLQDALAEIDAPRAENARLRHNAEVDHRITSGYQTAAFEHREARREMNDVLTIWRERAEAAEAKLAALTAALNDLDTDPMIEGWDPTYRAGYLKAVSRARRGLAVIGAGGSQPAEGAGALAALSPDDRATFEKYLGHLRAAGGAAGDGR